MPPVRPTRRCGTIVGVHIRQAQFDDLAVLLAIERSATSLYEGSHFPRGLVRPRSESDLHRLLTTTSLCIAQEAAQPVGYVSFYPVGPYLHLEELAVARAAQGQGIGTRLLTRYLNIPGPHTHFSLIAFRAAAWAVRLYAADGFTVADPAPQPLAEILEAETAAGLDPALRQLMLRPR